MCIPEIRYYEDVLANAVTMTAIFVDTGGIDPENKTPLNGVIDGLPIRGGCRVDIQMIDPNKGELNLTGISCMYINKVISGTSWNPKRCLSVRTL